MFKVTKHHHNKYLMKVGWNMEPIKVKTKTIEGRSIVFGDVLEQRNLTICSFGFQSFV